MRLAAARALARRYHRGQLDGARQYPDTDQLYVDHLDRVVARVAHAGGDACQQVAGYLHGLVTHAGLSPAELSALGVPPRVVAIVDALPYRPCLAVRRHAARVLSTPGAGAVLRADIADRLEHGRPEQHVRQRYAETLVELDLPALQLAGEPAVNRLVGALGGETSEAWWYAAVALGRLRAGAAVEPLLATLRRRLADAARHAPDGGRRAYLEAALCEIMTGDPTFHPWSWRSQPAPEARWLPLLATLAGDEQPELRAFAVALLGRVPDPAHAGTVVRLIGDPDDEVSRNAAYMAGHAAAGEAVVPLMRLLGDQSAYPWQRRGAATSLGMLGARQAIGPLVAALDTPHGSLGVAAAEALVRLADPTAIVPAVRERLRTIPPDHQYHAAWVLGEYRARAAVPELIAGLRGAGPGFARRALAEALGKIAAPEALPALVEVLRAAPHPDERHTALWAITRIGPEPATDACLAAADDPDARVREQALRALARCSDDRATVRLIAACREARPHLALRALVERADARAAPTLVELLTTATDRKVRRLAGQALVTAANRADRPAAVTLLLPRWNHPDPKVRRSRAWLEGRMPRRNVDPTYSLSHQVRDSDELVRAMAAASLGLLGHPNGTDPLLSALHDPSPRVRANAATALGRLDLNGEPRGTQRARIDALRRCQADPRRDVRGAATAALRSLT